MAAWLAAGVEQRVVEGHPEVSFATLAGRHLRHPKRTWAGVAERRDLLAGAGILPAGDLGEAGERAGVDDIVDTAILSWTAARYAAGVARSYPDPPEPMPNAVSAAIWA